MDLVIQMVLFGYQELQKALDGTIKKAVRLRQVQYIIILIQSKKHYIFMEKQLDVIMLPPK